MKSISNLIPAALSVILILAAAGLQAQDVKPGDKDQPEEKWNVRKEYDEHGNLIYYDSSYSRTWKHFEFPEFESGHPFENLDSLFGDFFHFPDDPFGHPPFAFSPFHDFWDSLELDFQLDSSFFHRPHGFMPFEDFRDTAWMDSFFPDSLFPDAFMPFGNQFFFPPRPFQGPEELFERHRKRMERLYQEFTFPDDSMFQFHPKWQQWPRKQKSSARGIEI